MLNHPPSSHDVKDAKASGDALARRLDNGLKFFRNGVTDLENAAAGVMEAIEAENAARAQGLQAVDDAVAAITAALSSKAAALRSSLSSRWDSHTKLLQAQLDGMKSQYGQLAFMCDVAVDAVGGKDAVTITRTMDVMKVVAKLIQPFGGLAVDPATSILPPLDVASVTDAVAALGTSAAPHKSLRQRLSSNGSDSGTTTPQAVPAVSAALVAAAVEPASVAVAGPVTVAASVAMPAPVAIAAPPHPIVAARAPEPAPRPSEDQHSTVASPFKAAQAAFRHAPAVEAAPADASIGEARRPRISSTAAPSSNISAMQSQLNARFSGGSGYTPFGAVPIIRAKVSSTVSDLEGERKSEVPSPPPTQVAEPPATPAVAATTDGSSTVTMLHTAQVKSLFKLSSDGASWDSKSTGTVGAVILGACVS